LPEKEEGGIAAGIVGAEDRVFSGVHPAVFMCREGRLVTSNFRAGLWNR
jgi:hypothetical protein